MSSLHIAAEQGDIAPVVLMPGDPKRSRRIAEGFLEAPRLINDVRGVQGYTGKWQGKEVTVMASGMGMPSIGIYSHELYHFHGVECILRVGTMGSICEKAPLGTLVMAMGASTDSAYGKQYGLPGSFAPLADYGVLRMAEAAAEEAKVPVYIGNVLSSDHFYTDDPNSNCLWQKMGVLGVEMEAAALYMEAARAGKRALGMFTVTDEILTGKRMTAEERVASVDRMLLVALQTATRYLEGR